MDGSGLADRGFQKDIDERAAFERSFAKPPIKDVENRQELALWLLCPAFNLGLKPVAGPDRLALVEKCNGNATSWLRGTFRCGLPKPTPSLRRSV